jgi:ribose 5-phosphate isomerase A
MSQNENELKMEAAESATRLIEDGMIVGLGSGTTAVFAIDDLGRRVKQGLQIVGIPTSERTADQARSLGIPVSSLAEHPHIDITIDGADQVDEENLNLVKGHGGALLREKIVACATRRLVIMVHSSKLVKRLALDQPIPVEVVPFGWQATTGYLKNLGAHPTLRRNPDGPPYHSDSGNYILDCTFETRLSAAALARRLDHVVGLVEHGLFIGMTAEVHVASDDGVRILSASAAAASNVRSAV